MIFFIKMEEARVKIIDKSAELFFSLGVKTVTMDYIAQEMGISKKTLYEYFSNKDELVMNTLDYIIDKVETELTRCKNLNLSAIEELFTISKNIKTIVNNERNTCYIQLKRFYPELFNKVIVKQKELIESMIVENLKKGITEQSYRAAIDVPLVSRIHYNALVTAEEGEDFEDFDYTIWHIKEYIMELLVRSIATEKGVIELEKTLKNLN